MGKQRLTYIDTAKGILILLMIWFHVTYAVEKTVDGCNPVMGGAIREYTNSWFTVFFMPAFFLITGYCSRFTEDRKDFYLKMLKTIIIPVAIITYIRECIYGFSFNPLHLLGPYKPNGNWFIWALLMGRTIFYESRSILHNKYLLFFFLSAITIVALFFSDNEFVPNPFYWKQGLCASLFIGIGHYLRNVEMKEKWLIIASLMYVASIVIINALGAHRTVMVVILHPKWYEFFEFVFLAITGTALVVWISKRIDNKLLSYIGRYSLVMYLMQTVTLRMLAKLFADYIDASTVGGYIAICAMIYPLTVAICLLFARCYDTKIGKYILGKY